MATRREFLTAALATCSVGAALRAPMTTANWGMPEPPAVFDGGSLVNEAQAQRVLAELGLDGLVAMHPVNVFYFGNHLGYAVKMQGLPAACFAVYPRDPALDTILVTSSADLWHLANGVREHPRVIPYSVPFPAPGDEASAAPAAAPPLSELWAVDEQGLTARETAWLENDARHAEVLQPTPQHALLQALRETDLLGRKIGIDDAGVATMLARLGQDTDSLVEAENAFRKIRVIKSPREIQHMRRIAQANQRATLRMLSRLDAGATTADIDRLFRIEAAREGASVTWLAHGSLGGLRSGELVRGEPILVDAVSQINYYCGDFGRTVVVGEPSDKLVQRTDLLKSAWDAVLQEMRPGVRYSDVEAVARKALARPGVRLPPIGVNPHSVGLQHTDEPYRDGLPYAAKDDLVLREGMTLTVDFPCLEPGWGDCHLEDLVVITADGVEALGTIDSPLVVL